MPASSLRITDQLQPIALTQPALGGEIGRRLTDLIEKHFMVLDIDVPFVEPFRARPFTKDWHYVGVGKLIDAGSLFGAFTGDPAVQARTAQLIADIIATRDDDGYIGTFQPEPEGRQNHHNWVLHDQEYLLLALVRHWHASGDTQSLRYARELGDYVIATFSSDPKPEEICTAGLPEAFIALHRATGEPRYLTFAAETRHGNAQAEVQCASLREWRQTFDTRPAHVYVMLARCYAQTELYRHDGDPALLAMTAYMRHELLRAGGGVNVVGSASDGEYFSYTQNGAGAIGESCVTAYLLRWLESLLRLDGDLRYGDLLERTIYNALFAAQDPAGRRICYFTPFTGPRAYFEQDGFCCPGNFRRIMSELPAMVYYRCADGGIAVNLYTPSAVTVPVGPDTTVTLSQETDYPASGRVLIRVTLSQPVALPLRLRIPRWCRNATVTVNDEPPIATPAGAYTLQRVWSPGDTVTLDLPMSWRLVKGRQMQEGKAALLRGPVVFCLGTAHNAALLEKHPGFTNVVIDPASLGNPEPDDSTRPGGLKVAARALVEAPGEWSKGAPVETVTFTEFVDPTGIMTYVHVLDLGCADEDELMGDCFAP